MTSASKVKSSLNSKRGPDASLNGDKAYDAALSKISLSTGVYNIPGTVVCKHTDTRLTKRSDEARHEQKRNCYDRSDEIKSYRRAKPKTG